MERGAGAMNETSDRVCRKFARSVKRLENNLITPRLKNRAALTSDCSFCGEFSTVGMVFDGNSFIL